MNKQSDKKLDEIKDAVDQIGDVKSPKHRLEMSLDLVAYIELHYRDIAADELNSARRHRKAQREALKKGRKS